LIQSIEIQNFQSHESTCLELHPGLNVLVGSGDSGKSAIHRAIRWNQSNRIRHDDRPMGDSYVSDWAKSTGAKGATTLLADCLVRITKPEGTCTRFREAPKGKGDKERNGYELNGQRFEAIGVTVPDDVSTFFNWSEVNVQKQQDQAFLLSKGAGEVATFLNRTVRLDAIDTHVQAANSLLRQERDGLKLLQSKQADDQSALLALAWVPDVEARLQSLEALNGAREALDASIRRLRDLASQIKAQEARILESQQLVDMEQRVKELRRTHDWKRGLMERRGRLKEAADQWERWEQVARASGRLVELGPRVQGLHGLVEARARVQADVRSIQSLCSRWELAERTVQDTMVLAGLGPRAQGLRVLMEERGALGRRVTVLRDLVERWSGIRVSDGDWEDLEFRVRRLRKFAERRKGVQDQIRGIASFRLTFAELETSIQEAGTRVAELVALRPVSCPLCGGPMHTGEHS